MRLFNTLYTDYFLPAVQKERYSGIARRRRFHSSRERATVEENRALQWSRLSAILHHAYETTVFYKRRFDEAGLHPKQIRAPEDLERLPVLTRRDIQQNLKELRSEQFHRSELLEAATGGTTDTPVPLLRDLDCVRERTAIQLQFNSWAGLQPGEKIFWLWGARVDFAHEPSWRWKFFDRYLMRQVWAPTSLLNDNVFSEYLSKWNELRPICLMAYPTPMALFCDYLLRCGTEYHRPGSAICTAEPLLPEQRVIVERALGVKVYEHYGSRDFGLIAGECEFHEGMHYSPMAVFFEFLDIPGASSDLKELIVTDLLNYGFPMIRYQINDCTVPIREQCPCGRSYPRIQQISGRTTDNFVLSNGDVVPGVAFTNRIIKVCPGLRQIQIIQEKLQEFRIKYVAGDDYSSADLDSLTLRLHEFLGPVSLTFEEVKEIPRERSGKTRLCVCKLPMRNRLLQTMDRLE